MNAGMPKPSLNSLPSGTLSQPRIFGVMITMPRSGSSGPGVPVPKPAMSSILRPAAFAASRAVFAIRSMTFSGPSSGRVARFADPSTLPSALTTPARIFVPPKSIPMTGLSLPRLPMRYAPLMSNE